MIRAHAALSAKGRLEPFEYDPGPIGAHQVDVRVTHCGICHTDAATVDNDFGFSQYPLVPGHEAVGVVAAVGAEVDRLKVGQRVGVGPMCGSCMKCEWCEGGLQHLCPNVVLTIFGGHHGGFATHVRVNNWRFAFPLPDEIKSEDAGPLMSRALPSSPLSCNTVCDRPTGSRSPASAVLGTWLCNTWLSGGAT